MSHSYDCLSADDRAMQIILDKVISHGYYNPYLRQHYFMRHDFCLDGKSYYMCEALRYAKEDGLITEAEWDWATDLISEYLTVLAPGYGTLLSALEQAGYIAEPIDLIRIYRNWANRPTIRYPRIFKFR